MNKRMPRLIQIRFDYSDPYFLKAVAFFEDGLKLTARQPLNVTNILHPIPELLKIILEMIVKRFFSEKPE